MWCHVDFGLTLLAGAIPCSSSRNQIQLFDVFFNYIINKCIFFPSNCRQADQERVKDYKKELREMKARVSARPYLFEQVSQVFEKP